MNETKLDAEFRGIISHAFLGEDQNISKESFDLAISECIKFHKKEIKKVFEKQRLWEYSRDWGYNFY